MPWDSVDKWRDEDESEDFWRLAGVHETITPELRERIDRVKEKRGYEEGKYSYTADFDARSKASSNHRKTDLSEREMFILTRLIEGLTMPEVAKELVLSPETIKTHVKNMRQKLDGAVTIAQAVSIAYLRGILPADDTDDSLRL